LCTIFILKITFQVDVSPAGSDVVHVVEYDLDHEDNLARVKRFPGENTIGK
jgi:hypothetical protein